MTKTAPKTLQDLIDSVPSIAEHFYNDTIAPHSREVASYSPVPMEYTTWRDEQRAWREAAVIFDQSHHMPEMFLKGPEAFRFLKSLGINSFAGFGPGKAKQFVVCNSSGYVIGDCILFCHAEDDFELVSGMTLHDWVEFQALKGGWKVSIERDPPTSLNRRGRTRFRFGFDGPMAEKVFQEVVEGEAPEIPFFRTATVRIAGCDVHCLRHGMAGHKGIEMSGPFEKGADVKAALLEAGRKYGVVAAGKAAYFSATTESGWMAYPAPAIYSDDDQREFREWLPADCWEAHTQISGSFVSSEIADYYNTPWELGYDRLLKFDHDFIGRPALEKMAAGRNRVKVSLVWDPAEVLRVFASMMEPGLAYKSLNFPTVSYGFPQADEVRDGKGKLVGISNYSGYTVNEARIVSLAYVDPEVAELGTRLHLTWGEPNGGSRKRHVERHRQTQIACEVCPATYSATVRQTKFAGIAKA